MAYLPLESNPAVFNKAARALGASTQILAFDDVLGLDPELLAFVPKPCYALCLLLPGELAQARRATLEPPPPSFKAPYFIEQADALGNACGTVGLIHALAAAVQQGAAAALAENSALATFLERTESASCTERGQALLASAEIRALSDAAAASGETEGAGTDDAQDQHFVTFVRCGDALWELDGRNIRDAGAFAVCHGKTSADTFVLDAGALIREDFMARRPDELRFVVTALSQVSE